jgi:hypothetical protein
MPACSLLMISIPLTPVVQQPTDVLSELALVGQKVKNPRSWWDDSFEHSCAWSSTWQGGYNDAE